MTHWTEKTYIDSPSVIGESLQRGLEQAEDEVGNLLILLEEHGVEPQRALDVACGIGRHSIELASTGITVEGIDVSPDYVEQARKQAVDSEVNDETSFSVVDMRNMDAVKGDYDVVLNWFAFGYFDDEVNEAIAEQFRERVAPNGALVIGVDNRDTLLADFQQAAASFKGEVIQVERREYTPETGRLAVVITKFKAQDQGYEFLGKVPWDIRLYSPIELRRLLERAGFSNVTLYSGLDGETITLDSGTIVAIAEP
jgi:ubiquinone/menaquinone biosynthesis C-methylase UbiE